MVASDVKIRKAVDRFLARGAVDGLSLAELATACDQRVRSLAQTSAKDAVSLGRKFVKQARTLGDDIHLTALRALGWAELVAGNYREAEKNYLAARDLVKRDPIATALIDRVLINVYMYLDDFAEAQRRAKLSLKTFQSKRRPTDAAKTKVDYANVLHRQDRHQEANKLYRQAASHFMSEGNDFATALCWYNQANTEVQLFDFKTANRLFSEGREIFIKLDQRLYATGCLYGLAWLHMLQGEFHVALQELAECEEVYRDGKHSRELVLCLLDRAESYLGLNLFVDARQAAEKAHRGARKPGLSYETGKAVFFAGQASMGLGQMRTARTLLTKARESFRRVKNEGFEAAASLSLAQLDRNESGDLDQIRKAQKQFGKAQLPLWEAICDLQILTEWPDEQAALKRLASNRAVRVAPHLAARRYTVLGDRDARRRRMKSAVGNWTKAADILDAVRAKLPPLDMRSSFFRQQSEPHKKLIAAEFDKQPLAAAAWSELYKTVGRWSTSDEFFLSNPARTRVQESLTALAGQVTTISGLVRHPAGGRRTTMSCLPRAYTELCGNVRQDMAALERSNLEPDSCETIKTLIKEASYRQPIVQFHAGQRDLLAFVHYQGESKSHCFVDGLDVISDFVARWRFLVECAPANHKRSRSVDLAEERKLFEHIGRWLLPPLEIPTRAKNLLVVPEGQLSSLPWHALKSGAAHLIEKHQMVFSPSIRHHLQTGRRAEKSTSARIFVGDTHGLSHYRQELNTVQSLLVDGVTQVFDPCVRSDWPSQGNDNIWHYTGHAQLRADNPFYSALMLTDGRLFAADFRLMQNKVNMVTLAACRTGQQTSLPGEESTGLVRSLLEMGARNVVASGWAVSDHSTSVWMNILYKNYLGGHGAARAVQQAALGVREKFPSAYHWGAFSVFGAG